MDHPEIRFQVLYYLYNKFYGGQTGRHQPVENILQETELKNIDRNLINGDIAYLFSSGLVGGKRVIGNGGYPNSIIITNYGIDLVENIISEIIVNIRNQQDTTIVKNEIELISKSDQKTRTTRVWDYVKSKPELFINIGEKVLRLFLSAGY
ncbi:MAG TPA: hypothetical protein VHJ38_16395 [Nitrososphaeraceae archaeon]|jgi:hypothetical protein|nr:hypothetical protein [Nitrososphaeraceae archaeon]